MAAGIMRLKKDGWQDTMNIIQYTITTATFEMGLNIAPSHEEQVKKEVVDKPFKCRDEDNGRERCPDRCKECQRFY